MLCKIEAIQLIKYNKEDYDMFNKIAYTQRKSPKEEKNMNNPIENIRSSISLDNKGLSRLTENKSRI